MTTTIAFNSFGEDFILTPVFDRYTNGRLAISMMCEDGPFAKITVNLPDIHLNEGEVLIKDYAENGPLVYHLIGAGWLIPTGREVSSGYVFPSVMRLGKVLLDLAPR